MLINAVGRYCPKRWATMMLSRIRSEFRRLRNAKVVSNRRPTLRPLSGSKVIGTLEEVIIAAGLKMV